MSGGPGAGGEPAEGFPAKLSSLSRPENQLVVASMNPTIRFLIRTPHSEIRNEDPHASQKGFSAATLAPGSPPPATKGRADGPSSAAVNAEH